MDVEGPQQGLGNGLPSAQVRGRFSFPYLERARLD